jgi:hypothetical protein
MEKDYLLLKRAAASRPSGKLSDDDYDVLADDVVVGRIFKANAAPVDAPWMWTLAFHAVVHESLDSNRIDGPRTPGESDFPLSSVVGRLGGRLPPWAPGLRPTVLLLAHKQRKPAGWRKPTAWA